MIPALSDFTGIEIVSSNLCVERRQRRFPRSKKRRIRKKWAARESNFASLPCAYQMGGKLICHPAIVEKLKARFQRNTPQPK